MTSLSASRRFNRSLLRRLLHCATVQRLAQQKHPTVGRDQRGGLIAAGGGEFNHLYGVVSRTKSTAVQHSHGTAQSWYSTVVVQHSR
eukprot:8618111-Pyramimonas_sp.AAC.1